MVKRKEKKETIPRAAQPYHGEPLFVVLFEFWLVVSLVQRFFHFFSFHFKFHFFILSGVTFMLLLWSLAKHYMLLQDSGN